MIEQKPCLRERSAYTLASELISNDEVLKVPCLNWSRDNNNTALTLDRAKDFGGSDVVASHNKVETTAAII